MSHQSVAKLEYQGNCTDTGGKLQKKPDASKSYVNLNIRLESYTNSGLCALEKPHIDTQICLEKVSFSTESIISYTDSEQCLPSI